MDNGKVELHWYTFFTNPYTWSVILLALVSVLYISAMFLSRARAGMSSVRRGPGLCAGMERSDDPGFGIRVFQINHQNPVHFGQMLDIAWMFIASFICFVIAVYLVWKRIRLGIAFIMVMLQFAFAWYGYGRSHLPYILYDYIHIHESITNDTMAIALITAFILGFCVLVPSLILLMRLFLFDANYIRGKSAKKG